MSQTRARLRPRHVLLVIGLLGLVCAAGALVDLLAVRSHLVAGRDGIVGLDLDELRRDGLEATVSRSARSLRAADRRARSSPFLSLAAGVPVVGEQVAALRGITAATEQLGREAEQTAHRVTVALDRANGSPSARVELLDVVLDELDRLEAAAAAVDVGQGDLLLPPVAASRSSVIDALDAVPERLDALRLRVEAVRSVLAGPSSYLVMVGNNAEMRAGAGMPLSAGLARMHDGDVELGDFKPVTRELYAPEPTGRYNAHIDPALVDTYPRWMIGKDFPETAVVPDFTRTAPLFADIAADTQDWQTDGAIHIDVLALAELLEVVGPVTLDGVTFTADSAPQILLHDSYLAFEGHDQRVRHDVQSGLAKALFDAIESRDVELLDLVAALQRSAEGRHLMLWSRDSKVQDLFEDFGASGAVSPFETLVSVQNTGANKLDWYVRPRVSVTAEPLVSTDEWDVTLTVTVSHPQRPLTASYIEGPFPELAGGKHRALVTVQLPVVSTAIDMPAEEVTEYGFDGSSYVIGTRVVIPRGEERDVVARFRLPRTHTGLAVVPSARVAPVPWTVHDARLADTTRFLAPFGPFPRPIPANALATAWASVLLAVAATVTMGSAARRAGPSADQRRSYSIDVATGVGLYFFAALFLGAAFFFA